MAEGELTSSNSWESWLGGWVQTAKEKSSSALEMVKKDLAEFTCTIQKDTEKAVEMTKESLNKENTTHATNRVRAGLTSFLDNISRALVIPPDDDYIPMKVASDGSGLYDRGKARLHAIQLDASTYMDTPEGPPEQYSMWLESFNMDEHKGDISELLVSKVEVRALYTKLVPSEVSHAEFWHRYFYRVHQLHCDEARKQALMKRADQTKGDSFNWDDEDDDWSGGEDEEDNHSDWEKMPRPSQLLAATKVTSVSTLQSEEAHVESAVEPPQVEENVDHLISALVTDCKVDGSEAELNGQIKENVIENTLETNLSVFAASSAQSQNEDPKPQMTPREFSTEFKASEDIQDASEDIEDASEDFLRRPELQAPSADLWSLHIPNDSACASHGHDIENIESDFLEPGSSLDIHGQANEFKDVSEDADSCAADGDVSSVANNESAVTMADGASGTVDVELVSIRPHQIFEPSPDVSAASVCISDKVRHDVSVPGIISREEFSHEYENKSEMAEAGYQPASATSITSHVEVVVPTIEILESDNAVESSASEAVSVMSDNDNFSQQTSDNSTRENEAAPESLQKCPQNENLVPVIMETAVLSDASDGGNIKEIAMRLKGDMVVVGDRDSPLSTESNDTKEIGLEEDWEQDFDIEITEDDLKTAENIAKQLGENFNAGDDDWENWE